MEQLIQYIRECIKPRDDTEFFRASEFEENQYAKLKQDGIMIIDKIAELPCSIDHICSEGKTIIRKNQPKQLEWLELDGTFHFTQTKEPIYRRLLPPPPETVNHTFIIQSILSSTHPKNKNYIEYGVRDGRNIEKIAPMVDRCFGVDIQAYKPKNTNISMVISTTDAFSQDILPSISFDYAFIDADHSSAQVLKDFDFLYNKINVGGYIFLHDTYPCMEELLQPSYCNDCYKSPLLIRKKYPNVHILTLPLNPGITIVQKIE